MMSDRSNKASFLIVDILNTAHDTDCEEIDLTAYNQRKSRTTFNDHQLDCLEQSFEKTKYLTVTERLELAVRLGLSDTQVKTWYQNRRSVWLNSFNFIKLKLSFIYYQKNEMETS